MTPANAIAAFRKTDIFPFNRNIGEDITVPGEPHITSSNGQLDNGPSTPDIETATKTATPYPPKSTEAFLKRKLPVFKPPFKKSLFL